jgi:FHA domain-containing protein
MTVICPSGHTSATTDYCDQCGAPIAVAAPPSEETTPPQGPTEILPPVEDEDTSPATRQQPCPACQAPRSGDDRYCEQCGHDFLAPPPAVVVWEVVLSADPDQFRRFKSDGLTFPTDYVEQRLPLTGPEVRIGRSRAGASNGTPDIDLTGPCEDPGVSREHAVLTRKGDGTYVLRDLGSTNGTTLNDDPTRLEADAEVPLANGDRIRVGAWTTITLRAR